MPDEPRTIRFCVLLSRAERDKLDRLAAADQRSAGSWLRVAIEREYAARLRGETRS